MMRDFILNKDVGYYQKLRNQRLKDETGWLDYTDIFNPYNLKNDKEDVFKVDNRYGITYGALDVFIESLGHMLMANNMYPLPNNTYYPKDSYKPILPIAYNNKGQALFEVISKVNNDGKLSMVKDTIIYHPDIVNYSCYRKDDSETIYVPVSITNGEKQVPFKNLMLVTPATQGMFVLTTFFKDLIESTRLYNIIDESYIKNPTPYGDDIHNGYVNPNDASEDMKTMILDVLDDLSPDDEEQNVIKRHFYKIVNTIIDNPWMDIELIDELKARSTLLFAFKHDKRIELFEELFRKHHGKDVWMTDHDVFR